MSSDTSTLDSHLLSTLEPEELEAMKGDQPSAAEIDALKAVAGDDDTDDGGADEVVDADGNPVVDPAAVAPPAAPAAAPAPAPAAAAPAPAPAVPAEDSAEPAAASSTAYQAALPEDFDEQVSALASETDALAAKFKAGEIDFDAYRAEADKLADRRAELNSVKLKADLSSEMTQQEAARQWSGAINTLFDRVAKNDGIDYRKDEIRRADLDTFVKALAANPATESWPMSRFLDEAHKRVVALHGPVTAAPAAPPAAAPAAAAPAPAPAAGTRKPPVEALPQTLASVPGGDGPGDVAGEFADIDRLDGEALEDAIAKMSPAQRERYMRGQ
ncbi:MAG: hypothetical protein HY855_03445 [Burkholderiales bacterium]|nr:hypothetical protein [Burkholderiales bacterium]